MRCPRCGFEPPEEFRSPGGSPLSECPSCGVVFAKLRETAGERAGTPGEPAGRGTGPGAERDGEAGEAAVDGAAEAASEEGTLYTPPPLEEAAGPGEAGRAAPAARPDRAAHRSLVLGLALAVGILLVPFFRFALSYLGVLVHELGHSAASWLFGYPAVPAFDFTYGGGVSLSFGRSPALLATVGVLWAGLLWQARRHPKLLAVVGAVAGSWALAAFTPVHEVLVLALGHGAELLFAGLCLHRAFTGEGTLRPRVERPAYALVAWFLLFESTAFAWGLITDPGRRQLYEDAKGGGHWMDFSRLAEDYLGTDLTVVAGVFLVAALGTPAAVWLWYRNRERWWPALTEWLAS